MYHCIPMVHGKIKYKRLPMGIKIAPDVFQNVISKLVQDMEYVKTYLDDLLILTNISFKDHLLKLETRSGSSKTLNR
jgi:dihydroorotate dehydrogenase